MVVGEGVAAADVRILHAVMGVGGAVATQGAEEGAVLWVD